MRFLGTRNCKTMDHLAYRDLIRKGASVETFEGKIDIGWGEIFHQELISSQELPEKMISLLFDRAEQIYVSPMTKPKNTYCVRWFTQKGD